MREVYRWIYGLGYVITFVYTALFILTLFILSFTNEDTAYV